jgi:hypothetical protein
VKGQNFFICSFAGHCQSGMKIAVNAAWNGGVGGWIIRDESWDSWSFPFMSWYIYICNSMC